MRAAWNAIHAPRELKRWRPADEFNQRQKAARFKASAADAVHLENGQRSPSAALTKRYSNSDRLKGRTMLDRLREILDACIIDHVDEYEWQGRIYLRLFIVGTKYCVWDGPRTSEVLTLINKARDARRS